MQLTLFDTFRPYANVRQTVIDAALAKANDEWKAKYRAFILDYADIVNTPFSAEDVRLAYRGPKTEHEQASGGIFRSLTRDGLLRKVGKKLSKIRGNELTTYLRG